MKCVPYVQHILNYFHCFFTSTIKIVPVQTILSQFKNKLFQSKNWTTTYIYTGLNNYKCTWCWTHKKRMLSIFGTGWSPNSVVYRQWKLWKLVAKSARFDEEKGAQGNKLNSKYVSSTPVLNIVTLLFVFIVFDTGKGQFIENLLLKARAKASNFMASSHIIGCWSFKLVVNTSRIEPGCDIYLGSNNSHVPW